MAKPKNISLYISLLFLITSYVSAAQQSDSISLAKSDSLTKLENAKLSSKDSIITDKDLIVDFQKKNQLNVSTIPGLVEYITIVTSFLSIVIAVLTIIIGQGYYNVKRDKINLLEKKLNEFYRPLLQALTTSQMLHSVLSQDKDKNYRALEALIKEKDNAFSVADKILINEIIEVGKKIERIIDVHSGHVLNDKTRENIGSLVRHLRIFRATFVSEEKDNLEGIASEKFMKFTYPREVNECITNDITFLTGELHKKRKRWY
ncbi:hypothetical protein AB9K26_12840 [Psychroserpens sp. XS_ASV72]|uniref:hypothetical protein n=1 Tax=Psychroserpens sp. XS_ASV72 TaxID=3241293 RepID=UPI003511777A